MINNTDLYMIINHILYYINYVVFYIIIIALFKKNIIVMFKDAYKKYIINKKNNYLVLYQENKHIFDLKKNFKEKNRIILFFKANIEKYIILKKNNYNIELENNKIIEAQLESDKKNIEKTLYENHLLEFSKDTFKTILFTKFKENNDTSFVLQLIKNKK